MPREIDWSERPEIPTTVASGWDTSVWCTKHPVVFDGLSVLMVRFSSMSDLDYLIREIAARRGPVTSIEIKGWVERELDDPAFRPGEALLAINYGLPK